MLPGLPALRRMWQT